MVFERGKGIAEMYRFPSSPILEYPYQTTGRNGLCAVPPRFKMPSKSMSLNQLCTCSTSLVNIAGSCTAICASIFRFSSIPFFLRPLMNLP